LFVSVEGATDIQIRILTDVVSPNVELDQIVHSVPQPQRHWESIATRVGPAVAAGEAAASAFNAWEPLIKSIKVVVDVLDAASEVRFKFRQLGLREGLRPH
jgi:hypothetical protein